MATLVDLPHKGLQSVNRLSMTRRYFVILVCVLTLIVATGADTARLQTGDKAPDFTATDANNNMLSLSDYRGKKNVVLVFNRAHW